MNLALLTLLLVVFVILFGVISYKYWPGFCSIINYCPSGQICVGGQCIPNIACNATNPCSNGQICYNGYCIPDVTCSSSNSCPTGQVCVNGQCVPNDVCGSTNPCPSGQKCVNGKCVTECITTSTIFMLKNNTNYLKSDLNNPDNVNLKIVNASPPFDTSFQFIFQKMGCPDLNGNVNYGDRVQLASYDILYAQCSAGTCSLNQPDSYSCQPGSWQTFIISSATGKTGQVCFNDQIILTQTVGSKCSMSSSGTGDQSVYCQNNNNQSIFTILPIN